MKKIIIVLLFAFYCNQMSSQELSYGGILGVGIVSAGNNNGTSTFTNSENIIHPTFGAYAEYNFSEKIGLKTNFAFSQKQIKYFTTKENFKLSYFEISPNFKYDFGNEYRKGFYMLLGPKISLLSKAENSLGIDAKEIFESTTAGAQLGFGYRVLKFIDIETRL